MAHLYPICWWDAINSLIKLGINFNYKGIFMKNIVIVIGISVLGMFSGVANADYISDMEPYKNMKVKDFLTLKNDEKPDFDSYFIQRYGRWEYNAMYASVGNFLQTLSRCNSIDFNQLKGKNKKDIEELCSMTMEQMFEMINIDVNNLRRQTRGYN